MRLILLALLLSIGLNFFSQSNYFYSDGNNNLYVLSQKQLSYTSVKAENSSSGTYSGGENKVTAISPDDFKSLESLFLEAISAKTEHQIKRTMQSAQLAIKNIDKTNTIVILKPRSIYITKIEAALKKHLN